MLRLLSVIALVLSFLSSPLTAQSLPEFQELHVNDFADMLTEGTEETLRRKMIYLKADTGVEMSVLTVNSMASYGTWADIAAFATATFNDWGIGDARKNDGLLLVIAKNDRVFRIATGAGYPPIYDDIAEDIVQFYMTPAFKDGDFDEGVLDGAQKMIGLMALPHAGGDLSPERPKKPNTGVALVLGAMAIFFGGSLGAVIFGPRYTRYKFSKKPCPQCSQPGMTRSVKTLVAATRSTMGKRETTIDCPNCTFHDVTLSKISRMSSSGSSGSGSGGSSFGGGSSSGGGASGKW